MIVTSTFFCKTKRWLVSLSFTAVCFVFYATCYVNHLHFHEQMQMFRFDKQYLIDRIVTPGGIADYLSEFIVQFAYIGWLGALMLALMLWMLQYTVYLYKKRGGVYNDLFFALSFLPSIGYLAYLNNDIYNIPSAPISLILVLLAGLAYRQMHNGKHRSIAVLIAPPVLFWIAGATFWLFPILVLIVERYDACLSWKRSIVLATISLAASAATLIAIRLFMQYPLAKLARGLHYNKITIVTPWLHLGIIAGTAAIISIRQYTARSLGSLTYIAAVASAIGIQLCTLRYTANASEEDFMEYDYLLRNEQWSKIIEKADIKDPSYPLSIAAVNLALAKRGDLLNRMFCYKQAGEQGLLPQFTRESITELTANEIYFHLGMINIAQRFATESQEGIPDYQRSARICKRLAETYLLNGEYEVASKYIRQLSRTLFYREWASEAMQAINNPITIRKNPEWNRLLLLRPKRDFLSDEVEADIATLYHENSSNKMARQYLLALPMLRKDLDTFANYLENASFSKTERIPTSVQEALLVIWTNNGNSPQTAPWPLDTGLDAKVSDFLTIKSSSISPKDALKKYSNTFWYYLLFK